MINAKSFLPKTQQFNFGSKMCSTLAAGFMQPPTEDVWSQSLSICSNGSVGHAGNMMHKSDMMHKTMGGMKGVAGGMKSIAGGMKGVPGGMESFAGGMKGYAGYAGGMKSVAEGMQSEYGMKAGNMMPKSDMMYKTMGGMKSFAGGMKGVPGGMKSFSGGMKSFAGGMKGVPGGMKSFAGGMKSFAGGMKGYAGYAGGMKSVAEGMQSEYGMKAGSMMPKSDMMYKTMGGMKGVPGGMKSFAGGIQSEYGMKAGNIMAPKYPGINVNMAQSGMMANVAQSGMMANVAQSGLMANGSMTMPKLSINLTSDDEDKLTSESDLMSKKSMTRPIQTVNDAFRRYPTDATEDQGVVTNSHSTLHESILYSRTKVLPPKKAQFNLTDTYVAQSKDGGLISFGPNTNNDEYWDSYTEPESQYTQHLEALGIQQIQQPYMEDALHNELYEGDGGVIHTGIKQEENDGNIWQEGDGRRLAVEMYNAETQTTSRLREMRRDNRERRRNDESDGQLELQPEMLDGMTPPLLPEMLDGITLDGITPPLTQWGSLSKALKSLPAILPPCVIASDPPILVTAVQNCYSTSRRMKCPKRKPDMKLGRNRLSDTCRTYYELMIEALVSDAIGDNQHLLELPRRSGHQRQYPQNSYYERLLGDRLKRKLASQWQFGY